jgi:hypothetical protein
MNRKLMNHKLNKLMNRKLEINAETIREAEGSVIVKPGSAKLRRNGMR